MIELLLILIAAASASLLTFFSGFGLGTLLMPVFVLFLPVPVAIALTGVVHLLNNVFKLGLLQPHINWRVAARFGIPSVLAALVGAQMLGWLATLPPLVQYTLSGHPNSTVYAITPVKLVVALLLLAFCIIEFVPRLASYTVSKDLLTLGGLLSGFFGGLSGNQGALRTMFLVKAGMSKEAFLATGVVIACGVDIMRLSVYWQQFLRAELADNLLLVALATLAAFAGAYTGNRLLRKTTLATVQRVVALMMIVVALGLGVGIL